MKVLLFGDSITQGIGKRKENYCPFLFDALKTKYDEVEVTNLAITGTTIRFFDNFNFDEIECDVCVISYGNVDGMLRPNTSHKPNYYKYIPKRYKATGMLNPRPYYSRNKIKSFFQHCDSSIRWRLNRFLLKAQGTTTLVSIEDFELLLRCVIKKMLERGIKIILTTTVKVSDKYFPGTNEKFKEFNDAIKKISMENNCPVVDFFESLEPSDFMEDLYHPNLNGYWKISNMIAKRIFEICGGYNEL